MHRAMLHSDSPRSSWSMFSVLLLGNIDQLLVKLSKHSMAQHSGCERNQAWLFLCGCLVCLRRL
jgi:hypothetical protein